MPINLVAYPAVRRGCGTFIFFFLLLSHRHNYTHAEKYFARPNDFLANSYGRAPRRACHGIEFDVEKVLFHEDIYTRKLPIYVPDTTPASLSKSSAIETTLMRRLRRFKLKAQNRATPRRTTRHVSRCECNGCRRHENITFIHRSIVE